MSVIEVVEYCHKLFVAYWDWYLVIGFVWMAIICRHVSRRFQIYDTLPPILGFMCDTIGIFALVVYPLWLFLVWPVDMAYRLFMELT